MRAVICGRELLNEASFWAAKGSKSFRKVLQKRKG